MQQAGRKFIDLHTGLQQAVVVAVAGGCHKGGIIACRGDQRELHAAPGSGAQGIEHRGIGDKVGSGNHHFVLGAGQQHRHLLGGGACALGRAFGHRDGGKACCGHVAWRWQGQRGREGKRCGTRLVPVAGKHPLHLLHHRALQAQHDVHPRGVGGLGQKCLVGAVLAADIGDLAVNQRDLAVVAQVNAAGQEHPHRVAQRLGHRHFDPRLLHLLPQQRMHHGPGA